MPKTVTFHDKAMAIADIPARRAFLDCGQSGGMRKLRALLPTVGDETIHADLAATLGSHEGNVEFITTQLPVISQGNAP